MIAKSKLRSLRTEKLVIATHNSGKYQEIRALLADNILTVLSATDMSLDAPEETGNSFQENALIKAKYCAQATGLTTLADDSGLSVISLQGNPGIYSARWAGPENNFMLAMEKIEAGLRGKTNRTAYFTSALALAWPDGETEVFEGTVNGTLVWPPRGSQGFGYDPIFMPNGHDLTFAEMPPPQKYAMDHRYHAFEKLKKACFV